MKNLIVIALLASKILYSDRARKVDFAEKAIDLFNIKNPEIKK